MERSNIIKRIKSKTTTIDLFNYDSLTAPPLLSLLSYEDIEYFRRLATSIRYSGKIDYKYSEIDKIMKMRGFVKLGGGTNRVVYRHLEIPTIVVKIAIDDVGVKDNPREYQNQFYLKPYVTKVFEVSPCGTVGLFERCDQITSREEFQSVASEIFDLLTNWIIGKYIMEDIGSKYFMNYCIRPGFGPVLCDFPYLYELDGNKLYCQIPDDNGILCDGIIDYDKGFNHLYCSKCGAKYKAIELKKAIDNKLIISRDKKENISMNSIKVVVKVGDKKLKENDFSKESRKYESRRERTYRKIKQNNPVDNIRITTSKKIKDESTNTSLGDIINDMNKLPEWDNVETVENEVVENTIELEKENNIEEVTKSDIVTVQEDIVVDNNIDDDESDTDIIEIDTEDNIKMDDELKKSIDLLSDAYICSVKEEFYNQDQDVLVDMTVSVRACEGKNIFIEDYIDQEDDQEFGNILGSMVDDILYYVNDSDEDKVRSIFRSYFKSLKLDNNEEEDNTEEVSDEYNSNETNDEEDNNEKINEDPDDSYNDEDPENYYNEDENEEEYNYKFSSFIPHGEDDPIPVGVMTPNYNEDEE